MAQLMSFLRFSLGCSGMDNADAGRAGSCPVDALRFFLL